MKLKKVKIHFSLLLVVLIVLVLFSFSKPVLAQILLPKVTCTITTYGSSILVVSGEVNIINAVTEVGFEYREPGNSWTSKEAFNLADQKFSLSIRYLSPGHTYEVRSYYRLTSISAKEYSSTKTVTMHNLPKVDVYLLSVGPASALFSVSMTNEYPIGLAYSYKIAGSTAWVKSKQTIFSEFTGSKTTSFELKNLDFNTNYYIIFQAICFDIHFSTEAEFTFKTLPKPSPTPTHRPTPSPTPSPSPKPTPSPPPSPSPTPTVKPTATPSPSPTSTSSPTTTNVTIPTKPTDPSPTSLESSQSTAAEMTESGNQSSIADQTDVSQPDGTPAATPSHTSITSETDKIGNSETPVPQNLILIILLSVIGVALIGILVLLMIRKK